MADDVPPPDGFAIIDGPPHAEGVPAVLPAARVAARMADDAAPPGRLAIIDGPPQAEGVPAALPAPRGAARQPTGVEPDLPHPGVDPPEGCVDSPIKCCPAKR